MYSPPPLSLSVQVGKLRKHFPQAKVALKLGQLTWRADLTPTALSRTYSVKLQLGKDRVPRVWLLSPKLETRSGKRAPHLYPDDRLCVYLPSAREWTTAMPLVDTIVPWVSEWLAHYEVWLATEVWTGGGVHPVVKPPDVDASDIKELGNDRPRV